MRVLVTGWSGHVGGAIAGELAAAGIEVVGLSRGPGAVAGLAEHVRLDLGTADFRERVTAEVTPCEAIVHAAARITPNLDDPQVALSNCLGSQNAVALAKAWRARLVYLSSVPVVGTPRELPITEDHPTDPPTAYHASKLFGEALARLLARQGLAAACLRLTSPVGPGTPATRILPVFVRRALAGKPLELLGQGAREQSYVDVRDVAVAVRACLVRRASGLYNVAGSESVSNLELARRCIATLGSRSAIELTGRPDPDEDVRWLVSIAKARRLLGYRPRFTLEQSIAAVAAEVTGYTPDP